MKKLAVLLLVAFAAGSVAFAATPAMTPAPKAPKAKVMSMKKMGKKKMGKKMMGKKAPVMAPAAVPAK